MSNEIDEKTKAELQKRGLVLVPREDANLGARCFMGSFVISILATFGLTFKFGPEHNTFFWIAPLVFAVALLPAAIAALRRKSVKKFFAIAPMSLMAAFFMTALIGSMHGMILMSAYIDTPDIEKFVASDFSRYERGGRVNADSLQAVLDDQKSLRADTARIEGLKSSINGVTSLPADLRGQLLDSIEKSESAIRAHLISDEELHRVFVVRSAAYRLGLPAGTTTAAARASNPSVDRTQLLGNKAQLERDYPLWLTILRKLTLI